MSWRTVVISSSAKLDLSMGHLVVRNDKTTKIHLTEIGTLLIESTAVSITGALLAELTKNKIKVIFCDNKRMPSSELIPYYGAHDTSMKVRNQITWQDELKKTIWTEIVSEKIRKQSELLSLIGKERESKIVNEYIYDLEFGDETNREGHAAKVYFNALFGNDFARSQDNITNAALNYGYSILLSSFNREIVANGYITQLGLFHDNVHNPFNLGSDLMEPFRPLVDRIVLNMDKIKFEHDEKMILVNMLNETVIIADRSELISNAIKIYCKSIFDAIGDRDVSLIKFYKYEL